MTKRSEDGGETEALETVVLCANRCTAMADARAWKAAATKERTQAAAEQADRMAAALEEERRRSLCGDVRCANAPE